MKKIIDGSLYDTDKAKLLGTWSNGLGVTDFGHVVEKLFRTRSRKYFVYGVGGPMSKYAKPTGINSWSGGDYFQPMTPGEARKWAEKHLSADEYSAIFGEPDEASDDKDNLKIYITVSLKDKLAKLSEETGKSISQIVEEKFTE